MSFFFGRLARELRVPLLGSVPIDPQVMVHADSGQPLCIDMPDSASVQAYHQIADSLVKLTSLDEPAAL